MSINYKNVNKVSEDIKKDRVEELKKILPEVFTEGKIDIEKLKLSLGEDIDERPERFNFTWAGKNNAIKTVLVPSRATLKPAKDESVKFDESENLIIEGDNLEVLKLLQKTYFGKVKMIYIDPPYNTGGDFVYHDDFSAPINSYLKQTGQLDEEGNKQTSNKETNGRYHSDWLSMMYPRLKLAWNLLKDDGVIFISIDDNELHNLRKIIDEVFGEENFVSTLSVENNPKGRKNSDYISTSSEYCVIYAKNKQLSYFDEVIPKSEKDMIKDENGNYVHNSGKRVLVGENKFNENVADHNSEKHYSVYCNQKLNDFIIKKESELNEIDKELTGKGYKRYVSYVGNNFVENTYTAKKLKELFNNGQLDIKDDKIYEKNFSSTIRLKSILVNKKYKAIINNQLVEYEIDLKSTSAQQKLKEMFGKDIFNFPKNVSFIKLLIQLCTEKDSIILDFFAGSGTTAQAVLELNQQNGENRKFILVQLPEKTSPDSEAFKAGYKTISDITKERVRRVLKGYGENPKPINGGFKVFKLSQSNYPEISFEVDPDRSEEENQALLTAYLSKAKQTSLLDSSINPIDVVYENIVKEGFSLNSKVVEGSVDGNHLFIVTDGEKEMRISLDSKISAESVKKLSSVEFKDKTFVCYDNALTDSDKANISLNLELKTI